MDVTVSDANKDYVLVSWKPPNITNEPHITGYFVDRLARCVFIGGKLIQDVATSMNFFFLICHFPSSSLDANLEQRTGSSATAPLLSCASFLCMDSLRGILITSEFGLWTAQASACPPECPLEWPLLMWKVMWKVGLDLLSDPAGFLSARNLFRVLGKEWSKWVCGLQKKSMIPTELSLINRGTSHWYIPNPHLMKG